MTDLAIGPLSFPHLQRKDKDYTRNLCFEVLKAVHPQRLTVNEIVKYAETVGTPVRHASLLANVGQYFRRAKDGWEFVQRTENRVNGRLVYSYHYDPSSLPRESEPRPEQKRKMENLPVPAEKKEKSQQKQVTINHNDQKFAMVIYSDEDTVIMLDQDKKVIQGRYLQ